MWFSGLMSLNHAFPDFVECIEAALPRHFSYRCGKLGPARTFITVVMMTVFGQSGYRGVLNNLCSKLGWMWGDAPSAAALCKARKKLTEQHRRQAFQATYDACSTARECPEFTYKNMLVVALDGTCLSLPNSKVLRKTFGCASNSKKKAKQAVAGLMVLWDVSSQQPLAHKLVPYKHCERTVGATLFDSIPQGSLLITDRGFPSFEICANLTQRKQPFLIRVPLSFCRESNAFVQSDETDSIVLLPPRKIPNRPKAPAPDYIQVRLIKVPLPKGKVAIFATNLMAEDGHSATELGQLYMTRWRIETAFREMKIWHCLENLSAKHVEGIEQEVTAAFIFALFVSEMEARVRKEKADSLNEPSGCDPLPTIRYSRRLIGEAVVGVLLAIRHGKESVAARMRHCIECIWRYREKRRVRPTYSRRKRM